MKFLLTLCLAATALSMYSCQTCSEELNIDYRGIPTPNDIGYQAATSFQQCCDLCANEARCNAWTYVFETQVCWLKTEVGLKLQSTGRISGLKRVAPTVAPTIAPTVSVCTLESGNVVYNGNDLAQPTQNVATSSDCCNLCGQTTGCTAWTHLSDARLCYLKSDRGTVSARTFASSGYLATGVTPTPVTVTPAPTSATCVTTSGLLYPGADLPGGAYVATAQACCDLCASTANCVAFDYFQSYCFLKSQTPVARTPQPVAGAVSGIKQ